MNKRRCRGVLQGRQRRARRRLLRRQRDDVDDGGLRLDTHVTCDARALHDCGGRVRTPRPPHRRSKDQVSRLLIHLATSSFAYI